MFLEILAPWIIESWYDFLASMSFALPQIQLGRYEFHFALAAAGIALLIIGWRMVGPMPRPARVAALSLLSLVMLIPVAILTGIHLDENARLPKFAGRFRLPATPEIALKSLPAPPQATAPAEVATAAKPVEAPVGPAPVEPAIAPQAAPPAPPPVVEVKQEPAPSLVTAALQRPAETLPVPSRPPRVRSTSWMPIFYGTNREQTSEHQPPVYSAALGSQLELGQALLQVPRNYQNGQGDHSWTAPRRLTAQLPRIKDTGLDLTEQFAIGSLKPMRADELLEQAVLRLSASQHYKDHALIFVPGHNASFEGALYRTAQLAYDLEFDGLPFVYSWPSDGKAANYQHDTTALAQSLGSFTAFLRFVVERTGAKSISIVAHGLGTGLTLDGLAAMKDEWPGGVALRELIFAAPDIDTVSFKDRLTALEKLHARTTLYVAASDRALNISRRHTGGIPRAGDVLAGGPLVIPGVETVDVSSVGTDELTLNYPSYVKQSAIARDIAKRLGGATSGQSAALETVNTPAGDYLRLH